MRLPEGRELGDWQEYKYVDILKYETPWRIRAKVAGIQQFGSQSVVSAIGGVAQHAAVR